MLTWDDLQTGAVQFVSTSDFFQLLLRSKQLNITGWAQEHDPLYDMVQASFTQYNDHMETMCALEINNIPVVFLYDPDDGYRSNLAQVAVVPGHKLRTRLPSVPITCAKHDTSDWDIDVGNHIYMIDVVALDTNATIAEIGTEVYDSYYPTGVARFNVHALNEALPSANNRVILEEVGEQLLDKKSSKKTKKI